MVLKLIYRENILDRLRIIKNREKVNIGGVMANITMDSGLMAKSMGMECGLQIMEIIM